MAVRLSAHTCLKVRGNRSSSQRRRRVLPNPGKWSRLHDCALLRVQCQAAPRQAGD